MDTFGARLKEERIRLGLSQTELGELGGVKKLAQINYEKGKRPPDSDYLAAIARAGVDITYLLTGRRSAAPVLTPEEAALLDNYRHCPPGERAAIRAASAALKEQSRQGSGGGENGGTGGGQKMSCKRSA